MNALTLRTLFITAVALCAAQASLASGCRWPCDPPTPRNGWQPAAMAKALPHTAAAQAPVRSPLNESASRSNAGQPASIAKDMPPSSSPKARRQAASGQ